MSVTQSESQSVYLYVLESQWFFVSTACVDRMTLRWQTPLNILFRHGLSLLAPLILTAHLFAIYGICRRTHTEICIEGVQQ